MFCSICGSVVHSSDRFCRQCGSIIPFHPSGAETRFVSVLCSDLSGYSLLAERLDPEDLKDCMGRIMGEVTQVIAGYGGTVEKYIGDAVVAIFGLHKVEEDDPLRAVFAARRIHRIVEEIVLPGTDQPPVPLRMHSGINAGEVIIDFCTCVTSPHGALGKPINIASRLCDLACDGEILIGEAVVADAMRHFYVEWMGKKRLKGSTTPTNVYRVLDEKKTPAAVHRDGGLTSPLVGREHERSILLSKSRGLASGQGGVICISGDAGVGKSRLIRDFREETRSSASFLMASCYNHASTIPYFPFFRIVPLAMALDGVSEKIQELSGQPTHEHGIHVHHLDFFIHGTEARDHGSPGMIREKLSDAVLWLLQEVFSRHPLILCIEDIHWADQSTLDLIQYLINARGHDSPFLMVLSHRHDWKPGFTVPMIHLKELHEADVGRMLCLMLDLPAVSDDMVKAMAHATGGNPFFLEEMVNYLVETGFDMSLQKHETLPREIPASLRGIISSRIDNLDRSSRRILQEASLIGRIFQENLLSLISSQADGLKSGLNTLMGHGFIQSDGRKGYAFRHDIIREVAGRSLLKKERKSIHLQIATAIEESSGLKTGDISGVLAHHFTRAQEYGKALRYHLVAARRCHGSGAWVEATGQYLSAEKTLDAVEDLPDRKEIEREIREGIWSCCRVFNPVQAIAALESLTGQYRRMGLKKDEAYSFIRLINLYSQRGLFEKASQAYEYGLSLCSGDPVLTAAAHTAMAYTYTFLGRPLMALELLESSRPALETSDRFLLAFNALSTLAATVWKADMKDADTWYARTKELSREYMDIDLMADIWLAHICCLTGRFEQARRVHDEVFMREKKLGRVSGGVSYLRIQGSIYFRTRYFGDVQGARSDLTLFDALKEHIMGADSLKALYRAWIALEEGRAPEAHEHVVEALPGLREGVANRVPYALNALSEARLMMGDVEGARRSALECIAWNERSGNGDQLICALRIYAETCGLQGDDVSAHQALVRAHRLARSMVLKPHKAWVLASWGNVFRCVGKSRKASQCYEASKMLWKSMGNATQMKKVVALERLLA